MALYSRRTLQRLIWENASFTSVAQRQRQANAINRGGGESLSTEWEIVILNALSQLATIEHETSRDGRPLDVNASSKSNGTVLFAADIATVYDSGRKRLNPLDRLQELMVETARKYTVDPNRLRIKVHGDLEGPADRQVMRLCIDVPPASLAP